MDHATRSRNVAFDHRPTILFLICMCLTSWPVGIGRAFLRRMSPDLSLSAVEIHDLPQMLAVTAFLVN
jgi:hypothetical protein